MRPKNILLVVLLLGVVGVVGYWLIGGMDSGQNGPRPSPTPTKKHQTGFEPQLDTEAARQQLLAYVIRVLAVDESAVKITDIHEQLWADACLGVTQKDMVCAQVLTPGYLAEVDVDGTMYSIHTDLELEQILLVDQNGQVIN